MNVLQLRIMLGHLDDVVQGKWVTHAHDIFVANETFIQVHHALVHLQLLLQVEAKGNEAHCFLPANC